MITMEQKKVRNLLKAPGLEISSRGGSMIATRPGTPGYILAAEEVYGLGKIQLTLVQLQKDLVIAPKALYIGPMLESR